MTQNGYTDQYTKQNQIALIICDPSDVTLYGDNNGTVCVAMNVHETISLSGMIHFIRISINMCSCLPTILHFGQQCRWGIEMGCSISSLTGMWCY